MWNIFRCTTKPVSIYIYETFLHEYYRQLPPLNLNWCDSSFLVICIWIVVALVCLPIIVLAEKRKWSKAHRILCIVLCVCKCTSFSSLPLFLSNYHETHFFHHSNYKNQFHIEASRSSFEYIMWSLIAFIRHFT